MFGEAFIVMRSLGKHDELMDEILAELRPMKAMNKSISITLRVAKQMECLRTDEASIIRAEHGTWQLLEEMEGNRTIYAFPFPFPTDRTRLRGRRD